MTKMILKNINPGKIKNFFFIFFFLLQFQFLDIDAQENIYLGKKVDIRGKYWRRSYFQKFNT